MYGSRANFKRSDLESTLPRPDDVTYIERQALHAFRLRFKHPVKNTWLEIEAPLPPDMRAALDALRHYRPYR